MRVLIAGGTGTLGTELVSYYHSKGAEVICISRDELKQKELKAKFPNIKCFLGDIREPIHIPVNEQIDILYHVAALKHIDVLEDNILEAVKTNIHGTINLANYAVIKRIPKFAFSSTDKAVYPINVYGHTKAICERYLQCLNETQDTTSFRVFRWGNVIGSRGSVLESFRRELDEKKRISLTHPQASRFWIKIEDAVSFMIERTEFRDRYSGIQIPTMKASSVERLAIALADMMGISNFEILMTGLRPGEKIHENITAHLNSENAEQYTNEELKELLA